MSKAQIRRFRAPALLFSYLLSEKLIQRLAILTFPFHPTVRTCTEDEHSGRTRRRKRHRFVQHIFAVYIGHVSVFRADRLWRAMTGERLLYSVRPIREPSSTSNRSPSYTPNASMPLRVVCKPFLRSAPLLHRSFYSPASP